jgi:hypothetical protein
VSANPSHIAPDFVHGDLEMRTLLFCFFFLSFFVPLQASLAQNLPAAPPTGNVAGSGTASSWPELLNSLGVNLFSKAHAAECTPEGETCTSNEQCCPGLECSGGPPMTCVQED